jgi:hypothetical protein
MCCAVKDKGTSQDNQEEETSTEKVQREGEKKSHQEHGCLSLVNGVCMPAAG